MHRRANFRKSWAVEDRSGRPAATERRRGPSRCDFLSWIERRTAIVANGDSLGLLLSRSAQIPTRLVEHQYQACHGNYPRAGGSIAFVRSRANFRKSWAVENRSGRPAAIERRRGPSRCDFLSWIDCRTAIAANGDSLRLLLSRFAQRPMRLVEEHYQAAHEDYPRASGSIAFVRLPRVVSTRDDEQAPVARDEVSSQTSNDVKRS